mmetsp:Transcript_27303/g.69481  ORF Transcript_27303/g.69481 Transcript_27303/m.69481 type:complete len:218 (-) Transcript_27303:298-951(-)
MAVSACDHRARRLFSIAHTSKEAHTWAHARTELRTSVALGSRAGRHSRAQLVGGQSLPRISVGARVPNSMASRIHWSSFREGRHDARHVCHLLTALRGKARAQAHALRQPTPKLWPMVAASSALQSSVLREAYRRAPCAALLADSSELRPPQEEKIREAHRPAPIAVRQIVFSSARLLAPGWRQLRPRCSGQAQLYAALRVPHVLACEALLRHDDFK